MLTPLGVMGGIRSGTTDATVNVLQGMLFLAILLSETFYGRRWFAPRKAAA